MITIGIDIGGTTIKSGLVNEAGEILDEITKATPQNPMLLMNEIISMSNRLDNTGEIPVGIVTAGTVDRENRKITGIGGNILNWKNFNINQVLEEKGFNRPWALENDVNGALLAEVNYGVGVNRDYILLIALGTGIGGAYYCNGSLYRGANGSGMEIGHMLYEPNGRRCHCGQYGCVETYFSGKAIHRELEALGLDRVESLFHSRQSKEKELLNFIITGLSSYTISLINLLDPNLIIFGGGLMEGQTQLLEEIESNVEKYKNQGSNPEFALAKFGNEAGIIGASTLVRRT